MSTAGHAKVLAIAAALVLVPRALLAAECLPELDNGNVCNANDLEASAAIASGPSACTEGTTIQATLRVVLGTNAAVRAASERFDIGFFVGNDGEPPLGGSDCTVAALSPLEPPLDLISGAGPYRDLDGDACGDVRKEDPATVKDIPLDSLLCRDADGDGRVDVDLALTWKGANESCDDPNDPTELFPTQSSKCRVLSGLNLDIAVEPPPSMEVHKAAAPNVLAAPGGGVSYVVTVANTSGAFD